MKMAYFGPCSGRQKATSIHGNDGADPRASCKSIVEVQIAVVGKKWGMGGVEMSRLNILNDSQVQTKRANEVPRDFSLSNAAEHTWLQACFLGIKLLNLNSAKQCVRRLFARLLEAEYI